MLNENTLLRTYKLTIQTDEEGSALIVPEDNNTFETLKLEVDIFQQTSVTYGEMNLRIFNLKPSTVTQTIEDQYLTQDPNIMLGQEGLRSYLKRIKLEIFNGRYSGIVFDGAVQSGTPPIKDNAGNLVTTIRATDGLYSIANCQSSFSLEGEVKLEDLIKRLAKDLKIGNVEVGAIEIADEFNTVYKNPIVSGGTWQEIAKLTRTNLNAYIYKQKLYVVGLMDAFDDAENTLNADSGLIRILDYTKTTVRLECLFNPLLQVGQAIDIKSTINAVVNGIYKISEIRHHLSIGDGGQAGGTTQLYCFKGITTKIKPIKRPNNI